MSLRQTPWLAATVLAALALPGPAHGAGWVDPTVFPAAAGQSQPAVAENANGDAVVAWNATLADGKKAIQVGTSTVGGQFGAPQTLPVGGTTDTLTAPDVAIGPDGRAILAYTDANTRETHFATRAPGQPFGVVQTVADMFALPAAPRVAIGAGGNAVLGYEYRVASTTMSGGMTFFNEECGVLLKRVPIGGAPAPLGFGVTFTNTQTSALPPCTISPFDLATNANGDIETTASGSATGGPATVRVSGFTDTGGGPVSPLPTDLGPGTEPRTAIDGQGRFVVVWKDASTPSRILAARGFVGSDPDTTVPLSTAAAQPAGEPSVGVDGQGAATGVWQATGAGGARQVFGATIAPSSTVGPLPGPFSGPSTGGADPFMDPRIAVESGSAALALWHEDPSGRVRSVFRPPGGAFGGAQPVAAGTQARVALGAADHGIAALQVPGGGIEAIRFDAAPPDLGTVNVPTAATVGQPVPMSAAATDLHGPLTFAWDFGDGSPSASGASVSHAYATAGLRTVTLTASDAAGNSVPTTRTVAVSSPVPAIANVTAAGVAPSRFKVAKGSTAVTARKKKPKPTPAGTTFSYTLSAPGTLTVSLSRVLSGRRSGKRCVAPSRKLRKARRCTRLVAAGTLTRRSLPAGKGKLPFTGRMGRKALATGNYKATLRASNAAGESGRSRTVSFTVVAR